jgi:hypothetical protein
MISSIYGSLSVEDRRAVTALDKGSRPALLALGIKLLETRATLEKSGEVVYQIVGKSLLDTQS